MYRRNMWHSGKWQWLTMADIVRHCLTLVDIVRHCQTLSDFVRLCQTLSANGRKRISEVRWRGKVYIAPIVPIGNQVSFTRQITSHPAHTSNLGKVGTQYLTRGSEEHRTHLPNHLVPSKTSIKISITTSTSSWFQCSLNLSNLKNTTANGTSKLSITGSHRSTVISL